MTKHLLLAAAAAVAATLTAPAMALSLGVGDVVTVTEPYDVSVYDYLPLNYNGGVINEYVGGQTLEVDTINGVTPSPAIPNLLVWCVDLEQNIDVPGGPYTFTLAQFSTVTPPDTPPGAQPAENLTQAQLNEMNWLASQGDQSQGTITPGPNDFSAAVQLAIWNVEYGVTYTACADGTGLNTICGDVAGLFSLYASLTPPINVQGDPVVLLSNNGTQELSFLIGDGTHGLPLPTPEPASLALLGAGLAGLGWMRRRRS
jgi:hypothetical protein